MPSEFDLLLRDLRRVQDKRTQPPPMAKAMPLPATRATPVGLMEALRRQETKDISGMVADLQELTAGFAKRPAVNREKEFFKSLGEARVLVGKNIAAGKISADAAIRAEMKLNALYARGFDAAKAAARP